MKNQYDIVSNLDDLFFQSQMLSGVAFLLWDSLAKPEVCEENHVRSLAAYFLYDQMEKFLSAFRIQIDKLVEQPNIKNEST